MWLDLRTIFTHLSQDSAVRAVVLSGAGPKAFTAGLDVEAAFQSGLLSNLSEVEPNSPHSSSSSSSSPSLQKEDVARKATQLRRHILDFQDCISSIERCEKPVIVALHGYTFGLGIDIAVCADVRICAAETQFAVKEVDIGLAADIGTLSRLEKLVGNGSWVKDVALSGRTFGAQEAAKAGFVSWVAGEKGKGVVVQEAVRWAGEVARKSPVAVQGTKELLNWSRDHAVQDGVSYPLAIHSFARHLYPLGIIKVIKLTSPPPFFLVYIGLRYTSVWNSAMVQTADVAAAVAARRGKKNPRFAKL